MRKAIFGGANSLDNYIARMDGSFDWIMHDAESMEIMKDMWPRFDTLIMGRKTYENGKKYAPKGSKARNPFGSTKTFVFSRTLNPSKENGVEIVSEDPGRFVKKLKEQPGKDIMIMGGGELAKDLFEAGVIDEIGFNIHPVLLGSGVPLFHNMKRQIDLDLIACRQLNNGSVYVYYHVRH